MKYILLATFLTVFSTQLHAQPATDTSLWSMIQQGGWAMYPLAACCLALIYLAIHCFRETKLTRFADPSLVQQLQSPVSLAAFKQCQSLSAQSSSALGRALEFAFPKLDPQKIPETTPAFEAEVSSRLTSEQSVVARWIQYLSVLANVSPMIGLLGTVSGMIGGFQTMSAGGMGRPELFAGDIGEALITTATGLCIGIPAMVAHSFFNNRLSAALETTTQQANALLDQLPKTESLTTPKS